MINKTEDPDFVASWQKVEEALKRLDKIRWNVCSQRNMRPWLIFTKTLIKELELKATALESAVASLKDRVRQ